MNLARQLLSDGSTSSASIIVGSPVRYFCYACAPCHEQQYIWKDAMMPSELPFTWGWEGMDLGPVRPVPFTYQDVPYNTLPPLPELDGTLYWLGPMDPPVEGTRQWHRDREEQRLLDTIVAEAELLGLTLPPAFVRFMRSSSLQDRIPEYAGSWFPPLEHIVPCFWGDGYLIPFMSDQQDVVVWFLYLTPQGEERVIGSFEGHIDITQWVEYHDEAQPSDEELAEIITDARICAPSFESFLYRFWLESHLWLKLHGFDATPLTSEEQRYLAHYAAADDTSRT